MPTTRSAPYRYLPGLALAAALAFAATLLARWIGVDLLGYPSSPVSPVLLTVLLGVLVRNTIGLAAPLEPGVRLCVRQILRTSVALLGIRLSLAAAGATGLAALPVVLVTIGVALVAVSGLTRLLELPRRLGTLIAVGTSICGITAIVATAPVIGAEEDETSYAVATIALFGMAALLVHPFLAHLLFGDAYRAGIFLGTAIHDTSQVAGAGLAYAQQFGGSGALETATVTKLIRNLCMIAVIPVMSVLYRRGTAARGDDSGFRPLELVPLFIVGFVAMAALRTIGDIGARPFGVLEPATWAAMVGIGQSASEVGLLLAMAGVGLGTDLRRMSTLGLRPLGMGMAAAATVGLVSYLMIQALGIPADAAAQPRDAGAPAAALAAPAGPASPVPAATGGRDTVVVAGRRYAAGPARRTLLGSEYRDLWATPVRVEILDLDGFAGGLEPVRAGGSEQTRSMRLRGRDGRAYNFRSVDKEAGRGLPRISRGWIPERLAQDQTSSLHPAAAAIAAALLDSVGILHPGPRLVVLPDHPRLGELRPGYGGLLGWIETHPDENRDDPAVSFAGAVRVVSTDRLFEHLVDDPELNRVDARAYLRTRLMDVLMGDWDRHAGQLRWARYDEGETRRWVPVPEDRDHAFVSYDGLLLAAIRYVAAPRARPFSGDIPTNLLPLVLNGLEMDVPLLGHLTREEWIEEAELIRNGLTDGAIEAAVHSMPSEWAAINAVELAGKLRDRRDQLPRAAGGFHDVVRWRERRTNLRAPSR